MRKPEVLLTLFTVGKMRQIRKDVVPCSPSRLKNSVAHGSGEPEIRSTTLSIRATGLRIVLSMA